MFLLKVDFTVCVYDQHGKYRKTVFVVEGGFHPDKDERRIVHLLFIDSHKGVVVLPTTDEE